MPDTRNHPPLLFPIVYLRLLVYTVYRRRRVYCGPLLMHRRQLRHVLIRRLCDSNANYAFFVVVVVGKAHETVVGFAPERGGLGVWGFAAVAETVGVVEGEEWWWCCCCCVCGVGRVVVVIVVGIAVLVVVVVVVGGGVRGEEGAEVDL